MGLWICVWGYGFVLETDDPTGMVLLLLSSADTEPRPFLLLTAPAASGLGAQGLGGDTAGTAAPSDPRDVPHHRVSCSVTKLGEKGGGRGDIRRDGVCLPQSPLRVMEPCFRDG